MKRRDVVGSALLVLASALVGTQTAQARSGTGELPAAAKSAITEQLTAAVTRGDTPGVVALVVDRNGEIYSATAGQFDIASKKPMPVDAIFTIASMTKPVTSLAIMMLVDEGKIALDDPVSKFLPGFEHQQVITRFNEADGTYETRPAKRAMTIRHLLTHTSGIGYAFCSTIVAKLQEQTKKDEWELPLLNDPGDEWHYSASTRVLGHVVEKVTGQTLEEWYQARIFKPLGMKDTSFAVPMEKMSRTPTVYRHNGNAFEVSQRRPIQNTPTPPYLGDGGLYSTAHDYGIFIRLLLNGGQLNGKRIVSERSVKLMGENNIGSVFVTQQPAVLPITKPFPLGAGHDKFGLGFQLTADGPDAKRYRSAGSMSWAGIYNTEFWIDPKEQIGGILLMQTLPFYDDGAIHALQSFEEAVYRSVR